jgi:hypothetical protein
MENKGWRWICSSGGPDGGMVQANGSQRDGAKHDGT